MKKVFIYTMDPCPYCKQAKQLLNSLSVDFEEEKVDPMDTEKWKELEKKSGMKTMPQIFIAEECIGGYAELSSLQEKGELKKLLED